MSKFNLFVLKFRVFNHDKNICLSNKIVEFCLKNNIGVAFNFIERLDDPLLKDIVKNDFYFSLTDSFIVQDCDELLSFSDEFTRDSIKRKYKYLQSIVNLVFEMEELDHLDLYISNQQSYYKSEYFNINIKKDELLDELYNGTLSYFKNKKFISFPTIHFKIVDQMNI